MSTITLYTSGSTDKPKKVTHSWIYLQECARWSAKEIGLTSDDIVLDVFPANTIAHWTITAFPAFLSGAQYVSSLFGTYTYPELFNRVKPTYIALIPRHLELLLNTKGFMDLDMSCVKYMVTGSSKIEQSFIDAGIGFVIENAEELSEKLNALDDKLELKQKIEGFINKQSGATNKIANHSFLANN